MSNTNGHKNRIVRECKAPHEYLEKGEIKTKEITVRYYSFTWNEIQAQHKQLATLAKNDPTAAIWPHETLADRIESLPDLPGPDGKPKPLFTITAEALGDIDTRNLNAIKKAIDEDFQGK